MQSTRCARRDVGVFQAWRKPLAAGAAGLAFYSSPCLADGAGKAVGCCGVRGISCQRGGFPVFLKM